MNTYPAGTADNNAVAIFKGMMGTRGSANLDVDAIVMHPTNWQATRLLTDSTGQFFGGGPFGPAHGGPAAQAGPYGASLWNVPVVLSSAVGPGTALLGSFKQAARIYRRGGVTVEFTNSHSDYFTKNLVAVRAECRQALCLFREHAFTEVTGLD